MILIALTNLIFFNIRPQVKSGELHKLLSGIISRGDKHIKEDCQVFINHSIF